MKVFRASESDRKAVTRETFTGEVYLASVMPTTDSVTVAEVVFTPEARTHWHSHVRGQLLIVTAGSGFVGVEGTVPSAVTVGDIVWTPAGELHWHGAGPDSCLVHTAISLGATSWSTPVTQQEYLRARHGGNQE